MAFKLDYSPEKIRQIEEGEFSTVDLLVLIWTTVKKLRDKTSIILWSSFVLLMLWGFHGDMALLTRVLGPDWTAKLTFHLRWGKELASFVVGFILMVVIPCFIIKFVFKGRLRDFGLGPPRKGQRRKAAVAFSSLLGITIFFVFLASFDKDMQSVYPLFTQRAPDGQVIWTITRWRDFLVYEAVYFLFFITIEFAFRGYLLFGLHSILIESRAARGAQGVIRRFGIYAILIQMLAYTTWHFGKPVPEMVGTIIWGICAAAIALRIGSIWPIIIPHWLYNVFMDLLLWKGINKKILTILHL